MLHIDVNDCGLTLMALWLTKEAVLLPEVPRPPERPCPKGDAQLASEWGMMSAMVLRARG